jgi:hypothetical protein
MRNKKAAGTNLQLKKTAKNMPEKRTAKNKSMNNVKSESEFKDGSIIVTGVPSTEAVALAKIAERNNLIAIVAGFIVVLTAIMVLKGNPLVLSSVFGLPAIGYGFIKKLKKPPDI